MWTQKQIEGLIVSEFQELRRLESRLAWRLSSVDTPNQTVRRSLAQNLMDLENKASRVEDLLTISMKLAGSSRSSPNSLTEGIQANA